MFARTTRHQNGSCRFSGQPHEALLALAAGSSCLAARYTVAGVTGPRGWLSTLARGRGATPTDDSDATRHWCSTVGVAVCRPTNRIEECSLRHGLKCFTPRHGLDIKQPRVDINGTSKFPRTVTRTKKCQPFLSHALSKYQT